jgi:hypothetical protein
VSRSAFAHHLGANPRTLERWEQGRRKPNDQAAALILLVRRYPDTLSRLEALAVGQGLTGLNRLRDRGVKRDMMRRHSVAAAAMLALVVYHTRLASTQPTQPPDTVPTELLALANRSPLEFATFLATAFVPSGIELREIDDVYVNGHPEVTPSTHFDLDARVSADRLVDAFNEYHAAYHAEWMGGVFVIRPSEGRVAFLDAPSELPATIEVIGAMNAGRRILCQLDSSFCSGVVLGSQLGSLETAGVFDYVRLNGTDHPRVIDTLNQIVGQSPRTWNVVTRVQITESQVVRYGFIHAHGQRTIQAVRTQHE